MLSPLCFRVPLRGKQTCLKIIFLEHLQIYSHVGSYAYFVLQKNGFVFQLHEVKCINTLIAVCLSECIH